MRSRIMEIAGWFFGLGALLGGVSKILTSPLDALYYLSFGVIIFPPISRFISSLSFARWVKISIGIIFFGSLITSAYISLQPSPAKQLDGIRSANVRLLIALARDICKKDGKCPETMEQIWSSGKTAPFESFKEEDYTYTLIENGKECLITTPLSTGQNYCGLCIGESSNTVKYLVQANCKP